MNKTKALGFGLVLGLGIVSSIVWTKNIVAASDERTISLYEIHLKETTRVTYKRNGKFIPSALKKLNFALRDWRTGEPTKFSPKLIDLVWSLHKELGSKKPVHVISGYRSPKTNRRLRRRGGGQAKRSQHMLGRAMDVHFPDIPVKKVRELAMVKQVGGVGYYPNSAIPFVHVDVAGVRAWPRMSRFQLARLFPYGKTRHRPSSGGRLTKRDQIKARIYLAKLKAKKKSTRGHNIQLARAGTSRGRAAGSRSVSAVQKNTVKKNNGQMTVASLDSARAFRLPGKQASQRHFGKLWVNKLPQDRYAALLAGQKKKTRESISSPSLPKAKKRPLEQQNRVVQASLAPSWPRLKKKKPDVTRKTRPVVKMDEVPQTQPERKKPSSPFSLASLVNNFAVSGSDRASNSNADMARITPEFDEDHSDELAYHPFQVLPLLSDKTVAHDTHMASLQAPNYERASLLVEDANKILPLQFRSSDAYEVMARIPSFSGRAVGGFRKRTSIESPTKTAARY